MVGATPRRYFNFVTVVHRVTAVHRGARQHVVHKGVLCQKKKDYTMSHLVSRGYYGCTIVMIIMMIRR